MTRIQIQHVVVAIAIAAGLEPTASAQVVDINGGSKWGGWNWLGGSQVKGTWVRGSTTRTYTIYGTSFVLSASQAVTGTRLADTSAGNGVAYIGDTNSSIFASSWQTGDRVIGIGVEYSGATRGSNFYFHTDRFGDNLAAASGFGATDGVMSYGAGDTSSYITLGSSDRGRVRTYSVFTAFSADGGSNFVTPYGASASVGAPTRSFAVLESGSSTRVRSIQYFINMDAVLRSNGGATFGEGDIGTATRFGIWEGETGAGNFTQQTFSIPAPASLALLGMVGTVRMHRRR